MNRKDNFLVWAGVCNETCVGQKSKASSLVRNMTSLGFASDKKSQASSLVKKKKHDVLGICVRKKAASIIPGKI